MKKKKTHFAQLLFLSLWLLAVLTVLLPARKFSQNENRFLSQMPDLSAASVQSGSFQEGLSDYLSDQIPLRSGWIRINTAIKKAMGRREINGIYLGTDHRYFQKFTDESYSSVRMMNIFRVLDGFRRQQEIQMKLLLVPSPGTILEEDLPKYAPYYEADRIYAAAEQLLPGAVIDLRDLFQASEVDLYYHTDHHWTTRGAELAYRAYAEQAGLPVRQVPLQAVSSDFRGTLDSRVLDGSAQSDTIEAALRLPKVQIRYDDGHTADTPYVAEKLREKDQYSFFFGGNFGQVTIDTESDSGKTLVILKDSFANSFVPFLFEDYSRIVLLDLRYFDGSVAQILEENAADECLILYEMSHFLTDTGILKLAEPA